MLICHCTLPAEYCENCVNYTKYYEEILEDGYKTMAQENRDFAKMTFELQRGVVLG